MTQPPNDESEEEEEQIDILHALKTAFSDDGDIEMFLARLTDQLNHEQGQIIETCSKHRVRLDDNLYSLLESRDAINEQVSDLSKCGITATETTTSVENALRELSIKSTVRRNLDDALSVATRTRQLTRMYAHVESIISKNRMHTALGMLNLLDDDIHIAQMHPQSVLQNLIPDTTLLRSRIVSLARQSHSTWIRNVCRFEKSMGAFAIFHAAVQALTHQTLLDVPPNALGEPFTLLPLLPPVPPRARGAARPWRPPLTTNPYPTNTSTTSTTTTTASTASASNNTTTVTNDHTTNINTTRQTGLQEKSNPDHIRHAHRSRSARPRPRSLLEQQQLSNVPALYLQPLLQAVHVAQGLGLLSEMRAEYRQQRRAHLQQMLENVEDDDDDDINNNYYNDNDEVNANLTTTTTTTTPNNTRLIANEQEEMSQSPRNSALATERMDNDNNDTNNQTQTSKDNEKSTLMKYTSKVTRAHNIEQLVCKVAGFFVVERSVEMHTTHTMVAREIVDGEWWSLAYAKLLSLFKTHEESLIESAVEKTRVQNLEENLERFAEANGLIK